MSKVKFYTDMNFDILQYKRFVKKYFDDNSSTRKTFGLSSTDMESALNLAPGSGSMHKIH